MASNNPPSSEFLELLNAPPARQAEMISELAHDDVNDLTNDGRVADVMATTNASGWFLDELDVRRDSIETSATQVTCEAYVTFSGDQDEDAGALGTSIKGTIFITVLPDLSIQLSDIEVEIDQDGWDD